MPTHQKLALEASLVVVIEGDTDWLAAPASKHENQAYGRLSWAGLD